MKTILILLILAAMAVPVLADVTFTFTPKEWGAGVQTETSKLFQKGETFYPVAKWEPFRTQFPTPSTGLDYIALCPIITASSTDHTPRFGAALHFDKYVAVGLVWNKTQTGTYVSSAAIVELFFGILGIE